MSAPLPNIFAYTDFRVLGRAWKALRAGRGAVFGALALFALVSCMLGGEGTAKRGSEVENEIHGVLVAVDGDPVQGAKVKAVPAGMIAKRGVAAADSVATVTDKDGKYSLRGLEPGTYNLFGEYRDGDLVVLIPGVDHRDTTKRKDQGVDTLRAPGRIRGQVLLGDLGKEGVLAYVPGTSYLAISDDSGRFVIGGVPQGRYTVRYSKAGYVIEPDNGVLVLAGQTVDLPAKRLAIDPSGQPPAPTGLRAEYDTLANLVALQWSPVKVADLAGYVVYREAPGDAEPVPISDGVVMDTIFKDAKLDSIPVGTKLVYRIKARDSGANLSATFSAAAEAVRGSLGSNAGYYLLERWALPPELLFRSEFEPVVFRNRLFLAGGYDGSGGLYKDIWSSDDGRNWARSAGQAAFGGRYSQGMVEFKDKLYLIGGSRLYPDNRGMNDVWASEDGSTWSLVTAEAGFAPRKWPRVFVHKSRIWVMGGFSDSVPGRPPGLEHFLDLWSSEDGRTWERMSESLPNAWAECCPATVAGDTLVYLGFITNLMRSGDGRQDSWSQLGIRPDTSGVLPLDLIHDGRGYLIVGSTGIPPRLGIWRLDSDGNAKLVPGPRFDVGGRVRALRFQGNIWLWTPEVIVDDSWRSALWRLY